MKSFVHTLVEARGSRTKDRGYYMYNTIMTRLQQNRKLRAGSSSGESKETIQLVQVLIRPYKCEILTNEETRVSEYTCIARMNPPPHLSQGYHLPRCRGFGNLPS